MTYSKKENLQNLILTLTFVALTLVDVIDARPNESKVDEKLTGSVTVSRPMQQQVETHQLEKTQTPEYVKQEKTIYEQERKVDQNQRQSDSMFRSSIIQSPTDIFAQVNAQLEAFKPNINGSASLPSSGLFPFPSLVNPFTITPPIQPSPVQQSSDGKEKQQQIDQRQKMKEEEKQMNTADESSAIKFPDQIGLDDNENNLNKVDPQQQSEEVEVTTISIPNRVVLTAPQICASGERLDSKTGVCRRVLGR